MKFEGSYRIEERPEHIWALLNTAEVLQKCIPGCEQVEQLTPLTYNATVVLKVGPIKARFTGNAEMTEQQPPNGCVIVFQGSGGIAGMARGEAKVSLLDIDGGTQLTYLADVAIGGKIAQIGSRLLEGTARKIADQFFSSFAEVAASS
jgi:carbon monoxide dehydrogenase subunit G